MVSFSRVLGHEEMANPYTDESGVFLNKLGVTDASLLKLVEYEITSTKALEIFDGGAIGRPQSFDLSRLQAIHRYLFQDVYEWAGKIRTLSSKKRASNGMWSAFAEPDEIVRDWEVLARRTNAFAASDLAFEQKREELLDIFIEANRIHPFPEGNGRSLQVFMRELAHTQGVSIDYDKVDKQEWNLACAVSGTHGVLFERMYLIPRQPDREPISKIFAQITSALNPSQSPDENIVEAAEAVQSEQQAMLTGASLQQTYEATLANYVEAKHNQVARLEDRLENLSVPDDDAQQ